ncbi:MAG TPA: SpoIID/LytB domain-containing protein [Pyrinomonadaceae bacterium]
MHCSLARSLATLLLLHSVVSSSLFAQSNQEQTRPRRVQPESQPAWVPPETPSSPIQSTTTSIEPAAEPTIRVALSTSVRSAIVSTTGKLINASNKTNVVALDSSRVRVEARQLSAAPSSVAELLYRVTINGLETRERAEEIEQEIQKATGEEAHEVPDEKTNTWGVVVDKARPRAEAEELTAVLENLGIDATVALVDNSNRPLPQKEDLQSSNTSPVRLTAKPGFPSREVVALSGSSARLFSSSAPVVFASDDEREAPVRYNDKPFRGRIEVFANLHGTLTVVNVLGLEDYVRGVVANELSAGGYPALEAHKAQAIAARTYALKNRGQFMSEGFDILPTTRSQVYRGLTSENPLSNRAVEETRGMIATYDGEPINALYTSTCGGRTESAENIFNHALPYLKGHECSAEGSAALSPFTIRTARITDLRDDGNVAFARDLSLLAVHAFAMLPQKITDAWLSSPATAGEVRTWLLAVSQLAKQPLPPLGEDVHLPGGFASALALTIFGDSRPSTLFNDADVTYLLAVRDADRIPAPNRSDVALLLRDGYLSVYPDATLRPQEPLTHGRVVHALARILENRNLLQLQKGNARPTADGQLILRSNRGKDQPWKISSDVFLFRQLGETPYPVSTVSIVGGEPVLFHVTNGQVDYLEVKPAPNGAAADRFSPFSNWSKEMSLGQVQARLSRAASGIGPIRDLRVMARGVSRRATDLEIIGANGTAHVRGGRIRSALGLREQLFVIDRRTDDNGRVIGFIFTGRGWGHGVGMCQVGAYGLAKQGFTFEQILKTYYSGIEITRLY